MRTDLYLETARTWILLHWIWGTPNTNNLHLNSCSLSPSVEIGLCFIRLPFSPLLWLHMAPSQKSVRHFIFGESWWSSEMLWTSPLGWSSLSYLQNSSSCWSLPNQSPYHPRPTDVSCDLTSVLRPLVIPVILSEMNRTLAIAMNPNWILYDTKHLNQFSQQQSFLWSLNCRALVSCNYAFQVMTR